MDKTFELIGEEEQRSLIFNLHVGFGKTVFALRLFMELGVKTLIVVNKKILMQQWIERAHDFIDCSLAQEIAKKKSTPSFFEIFPDLHIGVINTLVKNPKSFFDQYSSIIIDEVHFIPSDNFIGILQLASKINYTFGLSATSERQDKKHNLYYAYFDNILIRALEYEGAVDLRVYGFIDRDD